MEAALTNIATSRTDLRFAIAKTRAAGPGFAAMTILLATMEVARTPRKYRQIPALPSAGRACFSAEAPKLSALIYPHGAMGSRLELPDGEGTRVPRPASLI